MKKITIGRPRRIQTRELRGRNNIIDAVNSVATTCSAFILVNPILQVSRIIFKLTTLFQTVLATLQFEGNSKKNAISFIATTILIFIRIP